MGGDNAEVNPNGAYGPKLEFSEDVETIGDMSEMKVQIMKSNKVLATNELNFDKASNEILDGTIITSPFNLGTNGNNEWSWNRGAYAANETDDFESFIPDAVKVSYVIDDVKYQKTINFEEDLTLPAYYDAGAGEAQSIIKTAVDNGDFENIVEDSYEDAVMNVINDMNLDENIKVEYETKASTYRKVYVSNTNAEGSSRLVVLTSATNKN